MQVPSSPSSLATFVRARLSPDGYLGLSLTLGALALLVAGIIFGNIAEDVMTADSITLLDVQVSRWFHVRATPLLTQLMLALTHAHGTLGILLMCSLLGLWLARRKEWGWVLTLLVSVPGGMLVNLSLKQVFQRARPSFDDPLLTLASYSFPSGHAAAATLLYGMLAAWLLGRTTHWRWRLAIVMLAFAMVVLVAISRVYLGVHYPSDVLAAMASSSGWLAISLTAMATWRQRTRHLLARDHAGV
ncbi:MAG: phosphatase PAP2 family protein [Polaromonas sp.]